MANAAAKAVPAGSSAAAKTGLLDGEDRARTTARRLGFVWPAEER